MESVVSIMTEKIKKYLLKDVTFTISLVGAIISCLFGTFSVSFIDFKVIMALFGLMLVIEALKSMGVLKWLAGRITTFAKTKRQLVQSLVGLSFFASMFLTNDVAILTLLPVFLLIAKQALSKKELVLGTVLLIVAANLGSSVFPTGNPQNIYLFSYYHLNLSTFFIWVLPFFGLALGSMWGLTLLISKASFQLNPATSSPTVTWKIGPFIGLLLMLAYVTNLLTSWLWVFLVGCLVGVPFPNSIKKIDYLLLGTFLCFFLIVGNLAENETLAHLLRQSVQNERMTLWVSAGVSQLISNIPAAILLAPFTSHSRAMVLGTNIGGMGTIIASLANLIGYKVFSTYSSDQKGRFFSYFSLINFSLLVIFLICFTF
jgi:Na+/H+ antiporter NhaD/arsenite permease-like protein